MNAPVCYQQGPREPESVAAGAGKSERDATWERKREAFFRQRDVNQASPPTVHAEPHAAGKPCTEGAHQWFAAGPTPTATALPQQHQQRNQDGGPDPPLHSKRHEQQNDVNFAQINVNKKHAGINVLKPPGGGSSIDLGWNDEDTKPQRRQPPARQADCEARTGYVLPGEMMQKPIPSRADERPQRSVEEPTDSAPLHHHPTPTAIPTAAPAVGGVASYNDARKASHGLRLNPDSANRFASGSSQNTGNHITSRSTTRVAAPPGGASSICLG